jgi:Zn-dependent peptidase ImmA (M78 family)
LIVISSNWPGDRQRFTLAHELGHLILHERLAIDEEKACNRFAGAFLFPQDAVLKEFGSHRNSIELQEFAIVKGEYRLSMASICHRLHDLEIINEHYFNSLIQQFKHHGWNKNEPGEQTPKEKSHVFKQMIFHALGEEYISESKAAELLKLPLASFKKIRLMENHFDVGN